MHSFKDRDGHDWMLDLTLGSADRVLAAHGIDVPGLLDERLQGLDELLSNDRKFAAVVYDLCFPAPRTFDQLKSAWDGTTADAAAEAFFEELADFFPSPNRRQAVRKAINLMRETARRVCEKASGQLDAINLDALAESILTQLPNLSRLESSSGASAGTAPVSSASTPAPSPPASSSP